MVGMTNHHALVASRSLGSIMAALVTVSLQQDTLPQPNTRSRLNKPLTYPKKRRSGHAGLSVEALTLAHGQTLDIEGQTDGVQLLQIAVGPLCWQSDVQVAGNSSR